MNATQVVAGLRLAPGLPWWAIGLLATLCLAALAVAAVRQARGTGWRALAMAVVLAWLCGPVLVDERRTPLPDIALLAIDQTESMRVGDRNGLSAAAVAAIEAAAHAMPGVELRSVVVPPGGRDGTQLFAAIDRALAGLPRERLSAILAVTDGQVHDLPTASMAGMPLHVLLTGRGEETDRRLRLIEAPGYGVVGKSVTLRLAVDDLGAAAQSGTARVTIRRDGERPRTEDIPIGEPAAIELPVTHEGPSVVELTAEPLPGEVSTLNNRAVVELSGVRDRLRVLLVSGEPHAGERTWRRLLKADPAVDLVHFTILRPPEKDDLTPLNELALIAFPTQELFQQKVREFDLIILDRFQNRGILPLPYLRNIAEYVRQGGGLLMSVGPEFSSPGSLDQTPLRSVLPAHPVMAEANADADAPAPGDGPFRPAVTELGARHPVTANLPGWRADTAPSWGRWYRHIPAADLHGQVLMSAPDGAGGTGLAAGDAPLLLLDRVGQGRVALLLSDQIWLWARGHDGGGPEAELLRRIAHWLMKQPDLEENALEARIDAASGRLVVTRRSTAALRGVDATVTDPAGTVQALHLEAAPDGTAVASLPAVLPGVWQASDGEHTAYAAASAGNPRETADLRATATLLVADAAASGGSVHWLAPDGAPGLRRVEPGRVATGRDWIGLPRRDGHVTNSIDTAALLPDWLALAILLGAIVFAWWRESE